jgi:hypothetical protein
MRKKLNLAIVCALITTIGLVETVGATPDGSQRLRGMAGRVFLVEVEVVSSILGDDLPVGTVFPNCYFFDNGGVWVDPGFPEAGTWMQHSNGAKTTYTAFADADGLVLMQDGSVTPAHGNGVLQLEAFSTLIVGELTLAEFVSVGSEVDDCPL